MVLRRMTRRWVKVVTVTAVLAATLTLQRAPVSAVEPPDAGEPQVPSDTCQWYGELSVTERSYSYNNFYQWSDSKFSSTSFSSMPVSGQECGAMWSTMLDARYEDVDPGACASTSVTTQTASAEGSGHTEISIGNGYLQAFGYAAGTFTISTEAQLTRACLPDSHDSTTRVEQARVSIGCPDPSRLVPLRPDQQAMVGGCVYPFEQTSDDTHITATTRVEWRVVRNRCDWSVDSDTDELVDCREYELSTDPSNPDSDGDLWQDGADLCPLVAGAVDGCPAGPDSDNDRIPDGNDACPNDAGSASTAGCPDADGDGVVDTIDQCAATPTGTPVDATGCPPYTAKDDNFESVTTKGDLFILLVGANDGPNFDHVSRVWPGPGFPGTLGVEDGQVVWRQSLTGQDHPPLGTYSFQYESVSTSGQTSIALGFLVLRDCANLRTEFGIDGTDNKITWNPRFCFDGTNVAVDHHFSTHTDQLTVPGRLGSLIGVSNIWTEFSSVPDFQIPIEVHDLGGNTFHVEVMEETCFDLKVPVGIFFAAFGKAGKEVLRGLFWQFFNRALGNQASGGSGSADDLSSAFVNNILGLGRACELSVYADATFTFQSNGDYILRVIVDNERALKGRQTPYILHERVGSDSGIYARLSERIEGGDAVSATWSGSVYDSTQAH